MNHSAIISFLSVICPWLILLRVLQVVLGRWRPQRSGWLRLAILGLAAAAVLALPAGSLSVAAWVRGLNANFSQPLTGLLAVAVWEAEFNRQWFAPRDWTAAWLFGAAAGLALYPFALGWGPFDPYVWGWHFSPLFVASAALTAGLLWVQNRFGLLLLLAILSYNLHLLESTNYWDYLIDPLYCVISLAALSLRLLRHPSQPPSSSSCSS